VKADPQLGFNTFSIYNAAHHALDLVVSSPADYIALNHHARRSDSQIRPDAHLIRDGLHNRAVFADLVELRIALAN